ncbi:MAG: tRNA preQ1(34) S-adenosylmethionine ribosyltransferase-isomerase QueA [Desulfobacteraceae bacterium]|jgi:S-adenosylmethionine:tRNA ribosyltransferase-isomerase
MFAIDDYDYHLPEGLIAQSPAPGRDRSRLLVLDRRSGRLGHHRFRELAHLLNPGDLLVVNNTAVIPGRLLGRKATGGKAEVLILDYAAGLRRSRRGGAFVCECLVKSARRPKPGTVITFEAGLEARVESAHNGACRLSFADGRALEALLPQIGRVPLPPYIRRGPGQTTPCDDRHAYQTLFAEHKGAIAAPTAGLHFTPEVVRELAARGVKIVAITLHVGYGTFSPVRVADIRQHPIHSEWYHIPQPVADAVNRARDKGRRVVAVGTTSVRSLEFATGADGRLTPGSGQCDLFIYPGYRFRQVDAMITNFHLPRSTLLMLVSAFAGRERVLSAYAEAVARGYRFFSYGDATLLQ